MPAIYAERERIDEVVGAIKAAAEHRAEILLNLWSDPEIGFTPYTNRAPQDRQLTLFPTINEGFQQALLTEIPSNIRGMFDISFRVSPEGSTPARVTLEFKDAPEVVAELRDKRKAEILDRIGNLISGDNLINAYARHARWWRKEFGRILKGHDKDMDLETSGILRFIGESFQEIGVGNIPLLYSSPIINEDVKAAVSQKRGRKFMLQSEEEAIVLIGRKPQKMPQKCELVYRIPYKKLAGEYALVVRNEQEQIAISLEAIRQVEKSGEERIIYHANKAMRVRGIRLIPGIHKQV